LECTRGLYKQGLDLLDPEREDASILAGCILLAIGLEKFIKHVLESRNQLMILERVQFDDILDAECGRKVENKRTISLKEAFERLNKLYPDIDKKRYCIGNIINDRNLLVHGSGHIDVAKIECRVRVNIADLSELICKLCIEKHPEEIFSKEIWDVMANYREAYKNAEVLELDKRIAHFRRLYNNGEKLPCDQVEFSTTSYKVEYKCPICEHVAEIEIDIEIDVDHRERIILSVWPHLIAFKCEVCGFTLSNSYEVEALVGEDSINELLSLLPS